MSDLISIPTRNGSVCATGFGIGVDMRGSYTPNEILESGFKLSKLVSGKTEPYWTETFNQHVWITWDRLTQQYCQAVRHRLQLSSNHQCNPDDFQSYLGIGSYVKTWPIYLSTASRIQVLSRHFKSLDGLRILEIGCGCGHQLLPLASHGCNVHGLELNPTLYSQRHPLLSNAISFGDGMLEPCMLYKPGSFDVIIVSMVGFVHHADLAEFFNSLGFIMKQGLLVVDLIEKENGTGLIRPVDSYKSALKQAGFTPKYIMSEQLVCTRDASKDLNLL
jgi:2-polyprenyl-3-methyl-5-hydroxy-6-metoxy-1,4-benzoquinol methylase